MKTTTLILILAVASLSGLSIASKPTHSSSPTPISPTSAALLPVDPLLERLRVIPPEHFSDLGALRSWAKTSTAGGGTVQTLLAGETVEVAIAFRSHTSRYESSDAVIYSRLRSKEERPWQLLTYRQPVFRDLMEASVAENRLRLRSVSGNRVLLELPFDGLSPAMSSDQIREIDFLSHYSPIRHRP